MMIVDVVVVDAVAGVGAAAHLDLRRARAIEAVAGDTVLAAIHRPVATADLDAGQHAIAADA